MNKAKWPAFWFLLPAALLFIIFFYWPLLQNLYLRAPSSAGKNVLSLCFVSAGNFIPGGGKHSVPVDL